MQMEGVTGSPAQKLAGGNSLQGRLSFVLILSTGDEVSLRKMMVMTDKWLLLVTDKCFY